MKGFFYMLFNYLKLFSAILNFFWAIFKQSLRSNILNYKTIKANLKNLNFFLEVGNKNVKIFSYLCDTF